MKPKTNRHNERMILMTMMMMMMMTMMMMTMMKREAKI